MQEVFNVRRLEYISSDKCSCGSGFNNSSELLERIIVISLSGAPENHYREGTSRNDLSHTAWVVGRFCLDQICTEFRRDSRMKHKRFRSSGVLSSPSARQRLYNQRHAESFALPCKFRISGNLASLEIDISGTDEQVCEHCIGATDERLFWSSQHFTSQLPRGAQ